MRQHHFRSACTVCEALCLIGVCAERVEAVVRYAALTFSL